MTINRAIGGVSVLIVLVLAYSWWSSDERVIRRRLDELAAAASVPAVEGDLERVARLPRLAGYLAADVRVRHGELTIESRESLLAAIGLWRPQPGGVTVEFVDVQVAVGEDASRAEIYLTATITSRDAAGGSIVDAREATITMAKREGEWVVARAEAMETLRR
ncbi:MAG: hypothetical protein A3G76_12215 [Acidobacteria bacterium RIFCSPLOWO2_12_FULL_65_11]|nr:MAG: hypothetical protein A3H95_05465 [Acidobacteria bacterium RIFCSPLOWO2_02_FULL_64_15]OFW31559.1 MAG: hypothetical protein A3G76_12215 [Acidobacteria bacterium RIFCSPLOWO2_12_FULL_65_11]